MHTDPPKTQVAIYLSSVPKSSNRASRQVNTLGLSQTKLSIAGEGTETWVYLDEWRNMAPFGS